MVFWIKHYIYTIDMHLIIAIFTKKVPDFANQVLSDVISSK